MYKMYEETKNIRVKPSTLSALKKLGTSGDSMDDVIVSLLNSYRRKKELVANV